MRSAWTIAIALLLTPLLSGCPRHLGSDSNPNSHAGLKPLPDLPKSVPSQKLDCEQKIRQGMKDRSFHFNLDGQLGTELKQAEQLSQNAPNVTYSLTKQEQVNELSVSHYFLTDTKYTGLTYAMGKSPKDSEALFIFVISYENIEPKSSTAFAQKFLVNSDCSMEVSATNKNTIETSSNGYTANSVAYFKDGTSTSDEKTFALSENLPLRNLMPSFGEGVALTSLPEKYYDFAASVGLMEAEATSKSRQTVSEFGANFTMAGFDLTFTHEQTQVLAVTIQFDEAAGVNKMTSPLWGDEWYVPLEIWDKQVLVEQEDRAIGIKSELPKGYLTNHKSILLISDEKPSYPHFDGYWQITGQSTANGRTVFELSEGDGTYQDAVLPEDLVSNDTVQTRLPKIQDIAKGLETFDRPGQIRGILKFLKDNYVYDKDMVNDGTTRPLTTAEALERGKGICQHYALIFTAIARALKIPTRIVSGYSIKDSPVLHAWVEVETSSGTWTVIEPQREDGLTNTPTRGYLPLIRATYTEDNSASIGAKIGVLTSINYILRPAP